MREIIFRGKQADNGEWISGDLRHWPNGKVGIHNDALRFTPVVIPETVGQYTGLKDRNGRRIFEGDILEFEDEGEEGYEYSEGFDFHNRAVVVWDNGRWELDKFMSDNSRVLDDMLFSHDDFVSMFAVQSWVKGNIHNNPELLKEESNAAKTVF